MADDASPEPWFAPKSHGYGAGMPIHPNGWRLLWAYIAGMVLSPMIFLIAIPSMFGLMVPKTYGYGWTLPFWALALFLGLWLALAVLPLNWVFMRTARARTRGGWRWRMDGHDGEFPHQ